MKSRSQLNRFCKEIATLALKHGRVDPETNKKYAKVLFLGLTLYPNINSIWNFDILFLYKALKRFGVETRIHDPWVTGSEGLSMGVWLGRQTKSENWTHSYDVIVLSTPHMFYLQNLSKLGNILKLNESSVFLDIYGVINKVKYIGDHIEIVNFSEQAKKAGMLGGLYDQMRLLGE